MSLPVAIGNAICFWISGFFLARSWYRKADVPKRDSKGRFAK
jgi:peptidoglycan/LPS O-acetylase OafA/YrhL